MSEVPAPGSDLEHYVAAMFQAAGYFVEKNLVERTPTDVLELDIVITDYSADEPAKVLIEAKGGGWGWSDLFKLLGWMQYLDLPRGVLFAISGEGRPVEAMCKTLEPHGITAAVFDGFDDPARPFVSAGFAVPANEAHVALWRHSYGVERKLTQALGRRARSSPEQLGPAAAVEYHQLINNGTFFSNTPVARLCMLYDAYKDHPRLTHACAEEMAGNAFDPSAEVAHNTLLTEAMREGEHPLLQTTMYLEHRARVALLQAAIDFACAYPDGPPEIVSGDINWTDLLYHSLPQSFHQGIVWLRAQPSFRRYGILWQQFLWGWGGFVLDHRQEEEHTWMSESAGIPVDEIPAALNAYDRLFPLPSGWFVTPGLTSARRVKMVPTYFHGIGAHHRRQQYNLEGSFSGLGGAQYTGNDLTTWNNAAVRFLAS